MTLSRVQVCELTAKKLAAAIPTLNQTKALIGLDGFVDEIITVVDKRHAADAFDAVRSIGQLGKKINAAANKVRLCM